MEPVFESETLLFFIVLGVIGALGALCALVFFLVRKIRRMSRSRDMLGMSKQDVAKRWAQIEELLARNDEMSYKLAVMEADKLLDHALKSRFLPGNSLGERLRAACGKYPSLRAVWPAHLMRNKLVHEANYRLDDRAARSAISQFKRALQELGAL